MPQEQASGYSQGLRPWELSLSLGYMMSFALEKAWKSSSRCGHLFLAPSST